MNPYQDINFKDSTEAFMICKIIPLEFIAIAILLLMI